MKRYVRWSLSLAVTCGLMVALGACGGSSSKSATGSGGGSAAGGSAGTVNIGVVGIFSGVPGVAEDAPKVMNAWASAVNAAGGINGHKVNVIVKDIGTTTGAGRTAVQQLIGGDHVAAIISQDPGETTWVKYAEQQSVPVVSAQIAVSPYMASNVFPIIESPITLAYAIDYQFRKAGGVGAIGIPAELAGAAQVADTIKGLAPGLGVRLPVITKMSSSTTDFTPFCQQMKQAGVTSYLVVFGEDVAVRIMKECAAQKAGGTRLLQGFTASPTWKTDPAYEGSQVIDAVAPFFDESVPGVKTYRDAMRTYVPGFLGSKFDNTQHFEDWVAGQMVAAAAAKVSGAITSTSLLNAFYTVKDETLDGLIGPLTYTKGQTPSVRCWFTWRVTGGQFVANDNAKPTCGDAAAMAPAEAGLKKALGGR